MNLNNKRALDRAFKTEKELETVKIMPKARTLTEVSLERKEEKELEKLAPSTGYPDLDRIIKGFIPGHLYTLTGNTNVGKTSLASNFAVRIAKQGKRVLYFALEPENMVIDYLASVRLDKKFEDIEPEDLEFDDGMIQVYGKAEVSQVEDLVDIVRDSDHYDLIIIDHVGYFIQSENNWLQQQSNVVKKLAGLAKEKRTAILLIAHLRKRSSSQKRDYTPTSDDISGSGAFKQDSTEVMIVVRPTDPADPDELRLSDSGKLYVAKTKAGPNGSINLLFSERKANITSFGEVELRQEMKLKEKMGYAYKAEFSPLIPVETEKE